MKIRSQLVICRRSGKLGAGFKFFLSGRWHQLNARGNGTQALGYTLGRLTFTDKRIGAGRECGLLTGVQMD